MTTVNLSDFRWNIKEESVSYWENYSLIVSVPVLSWLQAAASWAAVPSGHFLSALSSESSTQTLAPATCTGVCKGVLRPNACVGVWLQGSASSLACHSVLPAPSCPRSHPVFFFWRCKVALFFHPRGEQHHSIKQNKHSRGLSMELSTSHRMCSVCVFFVPGAARAACSPCGCLQVSQLPVCAVQSPDCRPAWLASCLPFVFGPGQGFL